MYIIITIIIIISILSLIGFVYTKTKKRIEFYITGLDNKFSVADLKLLWNVAEICELDNPLSLFWSLPSLTKCMTQITAEASHNNTENDPKTQAIITKLFNYRTKLQNESDSKKGLDSTMGLDNGQQLRIILPGHGVFSSKILNNGKELICSVPRQKGIITFSAESWVRKSIQVYLWRKGDARYVFDTTVTGHGLFIGESSISLRHSSSLTRTQKRGAVRVKCSIKAELYIIKEADIDYTAVETRSGYKCVIEDISESGAMIRIGGKGVSNIQIKLQFHIQNRLILMFGVIRGVEYNQAANQSILHFECIHIDTSMRNIILSFVYDLMPQSEKEVYQALSILDADEKAAKEENSTRAKPASNTPAEEKSRQENSVTSAPEIPLPKKSENAINDIASEEISEDL